MRPVPLVLLLACLLPSSVQAALQFDFDYRYDSKGFFDEPARREALEAAGRIVNRYVDDLDSIIPEGNNGWASFFTPPDGSATIILKDLPVAADTMQIFVAGRPLPGRLAESIDTAPVGNGDPEWKDTVAYRGELGAADDPATDFGPMGGTISFNSTASEVPWHFGLSTTELNANEFDFITVAMHELLHLMGIGISVSFADHVNPAGQFTGAAAVKAGSSTNPSLQLDPAEQHWQSGTKSPWNGNLQEALLAPGIFPGKRAFPTHLDRAALLDIGWEPANAGDANRDRFFDSSDLVQVFQSGYYETGQLAGWADGDWNDNALFESGDLIEGLQTGTYEQAPMFAGAAKGEPNDEGRMLKVVYDQPTGQLSATTASSALTALQITSSSSLFFGGTALNLDGPFDVDRPDKLFVMRLDGFSQLELGSVLPAGLSLDALQDDLRIEGAWLGGGAVTDARLAVVPEPGGLLPLGLATAWLLARCRPRRWRRGLLT